MFASSWFSFLINCSPEDLLISWKPACGPNNKLHAFNHCRSKNRQKNPQNLTQLSPRSHPKHPAGKRMAQKDTTTDTTSDSQANSNLPHRWSPASLTFNIYFYLCLYLYITRITINNKTPHLKSLKNHNRRAALGRPATKSLGGSTSPRSTNLAPSSALVPQTPSRPTCVEDS